MTTIEKEKPKLKTSTQPKTAQGGARVGAGRPKGTGKYGEPTIAIRIPASLEPAVKNMLTPKLRDKYAKQLTDKNLHRAETKTHHGLPLFTNKIAAGFPSPTDDHVENALDFNEHFIKHPADTFYVRAIGESMLGAGIHPNDLLVVDRSLKAADGKIVIAAIDGELTVKRLQLKNGKATLMPENSSFDPIDVSEESDFKVWGVVTNVIHSV